VLELIDHGQYSVARLAELADMSQDNKSYDALAKLLKSTLDANKELVNLANAKRILLGQDKPQATINNTLVLTTAEILKLIKESGNAKLIDHKPDEGKEDNDDPTR
jgi:hypothetical protein